MNDDFSQRLLDKIEHEQIHPIPRSAILFRKIAIWVLLLLCLGCSAFLGVLVVLAFFHIDLEFLRVSSLGPMLRLLLAYIPVVWLVLFLLFFCIELLLVRRQTHAYRYPTSVIIGMMMLGALFGGLGFYATHLPERIESSLPGHLPPHIRPWFQPDRPLPRPEDGVLFGKVQTVQTESFSLRDEPGHLWQVQFDSKKIDVRQLPHPDQDVIVEGHIEQREVFRADAIRPYRGQPGGPPPPRP